MEIYHFPAGQRPRKLETLEAPPDDGFVWLDFVREESSDWPAVAAKITGVQVFEQHVIDSLNLAHPSFFDSTDDYEMVIFQGLAPEKPLVDFTTRPTAIFVFDRVIVTVRPADSVSVAKLKRRLAESSMRPPREPASLLHRVLSAMVDRFMALREPLSRQLEEWQRALLDPRNPFDDWLELMEHRNRLRRLEALCEEQQDAIVAWRDGTRVELDDWISVRVSDLLEHIRRVLTQAQHLQTEVDTLVQIHFSATAHRANEIMKVLTVVAAIFLPLTLIAGIFGMNFEYMPELKLPYAYFVVLALMVALGVGMLFLFRKRNWL